MFKLLNFVAQTYFHASAGIWTKIWYRDICHRQKDSLKIGNFIKQRSNYWYKQQFSRNVINAVNDSAQSDTRWRMRAHSSPFSVELFKSIVNSVMLSNTIQFISPIQCFYKMPFRMLIQRDNTDFKSLFFYHCESLFRLIQAVLNNFLILVMQSFRWCFDLNILLAVRFNSIDTWPKIELIAITLVSKSGAERP